MTNFFLTLFILLLALTCFGDQKAITDKGDHVILMTDGTWKYVDPARDAGVVIQFNKAIFEKSDKSSFLVISTVNNSGFWINPEMWSFEKLDGNKGREYAFQFKGQDLYVFAITEKAVFQVETLIGLSLETARKHAPGTEIARREYRIVNGEKMVFQELSVSNQGAEYTFLCYYYSDSSGSTQLMTFTDAETVSEYRPEIMEILNGLVTQ